MPACVLRVYGEAFDVDGYLATSPFVPCAVFRCGQPRITGSTRLSDRSGFSLVVSEAGGDCVPLQIRDALAFVESRRPELVRLMSWPGVDDVTLDFGWDFPHERTAGQFNYFPPALLQACGALGIGIEISVYATSGKAALEGGEPSGAASGGGV